MKQVARLMSGFGRWAAVRGGPGPGMPAASTPAAACAD